MAAQVQPKQMQVDVWHKSQFDCYFGNDTPNITTVEEVTEERDLGVYMRSDLKSSLQCTSQQIKLWVSFWNGEAQPGTS